MSRQAHILSFDDVKRGGSRYPEHQHRDRAERSQAGRARAGQRPSQAPCRQSSPLLSYLSEDAFAQPYSEEEAFRHPAQQRRGASRAARKRDEAVAEQRRSSRVSAQERDERAQEPEEGRITAADRRRAKVKARAKAKAGRAFEKQFGGQAPESDDSPRAAVYKGQMGASQRRAQRMQADEAAPSRNRRRARFSKDALMGAMGSRTFMIGAAVAACLVMSTVFLYPTAQRYYCSVRDHDKLVIEYDALVDRNQELQSDVDSLQTDAGVEQRAHEQLGWVKKGEESANVRGLNLEETQQGSTITPNISSDSVQAPDTWYSPLLDLVFGYK